MIQNPKLSDPKLSLTDQTQNVPMSRSMFVLELGKEFYPCHWCSKHDPLQIMFKVGCVIGLSWTPQNMDIANNALRKWKDV